MWLIKTSSYELESFSHPPQYAILSHTWGEEEVNFQQIQNLQVARNKKGWGKIEQTCRLAAAQGIEWAWIDTCCIDKSSSAELSEAINSMFKWYKEALVCYVWLSDLRTPSDKSTPSVLNDALSRCRWFSRGWTLQELIAPERMIFYDAEWAVRGTKKSMVDTLAKVTSIDRAVLAHEADLLTVPVARRMAWSAGRETTRVEDMAYSLLGIFDVNMPMIYGEGDKAFLRLQEAIALTNNDLSLFAWSGGLSRGKHNHRRQGSMWHGAFAYCTCQFAWCLNLVNVRNPLHYYVRAFTIANRGLEFLACLGMDQTSGEYIMDLHCEYRLSKSSEGRRTAIRLLKTPHGFVRSTTKLFQFSTDTIPFGWESFPRSVNIPKHISLAEAQRMRSQFRNAFRFWMQSPKGWRCHFSINPPNAVHLQTQSTSRVTDPPFWDPCRNVFLTESYPYFVGVLYITLFSTESTVSLPSSPLLVLCGFQPASTTGSPSSEPVPWVKLQGYGRWERLVKATGTLEYDRQLNDLIQTREHIHYSQFLEKVGQLIRKEVGSNQMIAGQNSLSSTSDLFSRIFSGLRDPISGVTITASFSAVGSGDRLTHDITIVVEESTKVELGSSVEEPSSEEPTSEEPVTPDRPGRPGIGVETAKEPMEQIPP